MLEGIDQEKVSLYRQGNFVDLCRGPHIPSTGLLKAFKLTTSSGAYWRGDERRPMLQRIYGTAFATPKELKQHLEFLEEAKRRDHRRLGRELGLFSIEEEAGAGMVIYHPKGAILRSLIEDFERREHFKRGYQMVMGPQMLRADLWERSGHMANYKENMYFSEVEGQMYGIKPMNCVAHMLIYKSRVRSYRELPIRYFELGTVLRHERSGVLHGLTRVRQFTQDDAHIICTPGAGGKRNRRGPGLRLPGHGRLRVRIRSGTLHPAGEVHRQRRRMGTGHQRPDPGHGGREACLITSARAKAPFTAPRSTSSSRTPSTAAGSAPPSSAISPCRSASTSPTWGPTAAATGR